MEISLHIESQFFVAAHHYNRHDITGRKKERRIENIFRFVHFGPSDLKNDVTRLHS